MKIPFTCFYALVQAAGIKTVRIKAGRCVRQPQTVFRGEGVCRLEKNLFWTLAQSRPLPGIRL